MGAYPLTDDLLALYVYPSLEGFYVGLCCWYVWWLGEVTVWFMQIVVFAWVVHPVLVKCIFEGLGILRVDYFFWEPIPSGGHSDSEKVFPDV